MVDQRIAYYQPNIRCRRNWIPLFIQSLGIIRNNSYVVHKAYFERMGTTKKKKDMLRTHKKFSLDMVSELLMLSNRFKSFPINDFPASNNTDFSKRSSKDSPLFSIRNIGLGVNNSSPNKRLKVPKERPDKVFAIFPNRFSRPRSLHVPVSAPDGSRGRCVWCKVVHAEKVGNNLDTNYQKEVNKTRTVCSYCSTKKVNCHLCDDHFSLFHDTCHDV